LEDTAERTKDVIKRMSGEVDHIFFCHGVINFMGGLDAPEEEWDRVHKINVRSTMQIMSICLPFLRVPPGGTVTVLSSSAGEKPWPGHTVYNAAMASLNAMVRCAALENAHLNVRINAVAPGYVLNMSRTKSQRYLPHRYGGNLEGAAESTTLNKMRGPLTAELTRQLLGQEEANTPLVQLEVDLDKGKHRLVHQLNDATDVAEQMLYVGSSYASFVNGQVLVVDGGMQVTGNGYTEYAEFARRMEEQESY
jgi:NAD(P)-dependent dehydrogenase (short-subunit alcohol dehydrogenase family)